MHCPRVYFCNIGSICTDSLRHGNGLSALLLLTRAAKSSAAKSSAAKTRSMESGLVNGVSKAAHGFLKSNCAVLPRNRDKPAPVKVLTKIYMSIQIRELSDGLPSGQSSNSHTSPSSGTPSGHRIVPRASALR